ncbi:photosystem II [Salvia divinorum]|uniref:Eukaryotic translation initiation factor 5B n=1 Tax=Salvia divinorum TaxID=28513 RepID=A0ABD1I0B9_SALDI
MGRKKITARGESKKKWLVILSDDGYTELYEEAVIPKPLVNKKKGEYGGSAFGLLEKDDDGELGLPEISFSGKKRPSKNKESGSNVFELLEGEEEGGDRDESSEEEHGDVGYTLSDIVEQGGDSRDKKPNSEDLASKNKRKKKKGGENHQEEEEDLDKILAELGVGPSAAEEKLPNQPAEQEEGSVETVTSNKKKKKKSKEKERATSAPAMEEKPEETKTETNRSKKVPKHVREIQERLAQLKEAEERKRREEEEMLRKEEEERLKQEERERLAEEKRRLKREREKEKLLRKRQEGKLLTGKQKEDARRLEAMRKQILANAKLDLPTGAPAKRPLYQKKKSKPQNQSNGAAISENGESTDAKVIQQNVFEDNGADEEEIEEEDDDDGDEEWDAKNWDEADLKLPGKSGFAVEEVDSEPDTICLDEKVTSLRPPKLENADVQKNSVAEKNNTKNSSNQDKKNKKEVADDQPVQNGLNLRSPICCIMGHVDAGKTKLLDCIRGTRVQEGEAGGITQQIGATYFPAENIRERTKELKANAKLNVPGLLVIDTPGHKSFTNLRSRGSSLCDIAVLVVDIMHGLEPQTIESLNFLKKGNTNFVIALNKVDRLYGWKTCRNAPIGKAIGQQSKDVMMEFNTRLTQIITQFKEQGLNTELYYKNKEMGDTYNIVPTSAISGEGIPDLLLLLVQWAPKTMIKRLTCSEKLQCTVLEVKVVEGHGTTIDVVLVNGMLHEGDRIVVCGMQGPVVTSIRALLTPHPMRELRVKGTYLHHKEIKVVQGIKIAAQGLQHAIAGTSLYVVGPNDDIEYIKESAMDDVNSVISRIDKSDEGVYVQASTLGSLEALLEFLNTRAVDVPVSDNLEEERKREAVEEAVFPCVLKIIPKYVFNTKDPIVLGVDVVEGIAKIGTPICVPGQKFVEIGRISSIINHHKQHVDHAESGQKVIITIIGSNAEEQKKMLGIHFHLADELVSKISRNSLYALRKHHLSVMSAEKRLLLRLRKLFKIL